MDTRASPGKESKRWTAAPAVWLGAIGSIAIVLDARGASGRDERSKDRDLPVALRSLRVGPTPASVRADPATPRPESCDRCGRAHGGCAPYLGPAHGRLAWRVATAGPIRGQAVAGADGTVYAASHDGHLYAVRPDGTVAWKGELGAASEVGPLVLDDGGVCAGSDASVLLCFDRTGALRLRVDAPGPVDRAATEAPGGRILFGAGETLVALERDGSPAWRFRAYSKIFTSPAIDAGGRVYFGSQDHQLYALDPAGEPRWIHRAAADIDAGPAVGSDGTVLFGTDDGTVCALAADGSRRWSRTFEGPVRAPPAVTSGGDVVVTVGGLRPAVVALDGATGRVVWRHRLGLADSPSAGSRSGPLVDAAGNVYVGTDDGEVVALAPDGRARWSFATAGAIHASPLITRDGTLYVGSDDGALYAFRE